jgi:hypothetical protein
MKEKRELEEKVVVIENKNTEKEAALLSKIDNLKYENQQIKTLQQNMDQQQIEDYIELFNETEINIVQTLLNE